jgi:RNA polymerase sigma factor (sigma-70 family)
MEKTYDSLDTYLNLAKKTIAKFAPKFYNGLSTEMLKNNDAISDVATAIMYADWRYNPERKGKNGQSKTLYSYRNQCAIWAIKTYVTNKYKKNNTHISLDCLSKISDQSLHDILEDKSCINPETILMQKELNTNLNSSINDLLQSSQLTEKQRTQLRMYYLENKTLSLIGKKFGVSREAVRQNIKRAMELIKSYDTKCTN